MYPANYCLKHFKLFISFPRSSEEDEVGESMKMSVSTPVLNLDNNGHANQADQVYSVMQSDQNSSKTETFLAHSL